MAQVDPVGDAPPDADVDSRRTAFNRRPHQSDLRPDRDHPVLIFVEALASPGIRRPQYHTGFCPNGRVGRIRLANNTSEEIRLPDEVCHIAAHRGVIKLGRRARLDDATVPHDANSVAHGQRFLLVVGDQDKGDTHLPLQRLELHLHFPSQLAVERRQWLV